MKPVYAVPKVDKKKAPAQQKKKLIDEHVVRYVAEHEMVGGGIS